MDSTAVILTAHQRHKGGCLCGWDELGKSHPEHQAAMLREAGLLAAPNTEHLKKIWVAGGSKRGKTNGLVMLCSGPGCGGAEMFARLNAADIGEQANAHIARMAELWTP